MTQAYVKVEEFGACNTGGERPRITAAHALSRERIEARVRAECIASERTRIDNACEQLDAIAEAVGLTEHEREVTQQSVLDVVRELVAHDEMNAKAVRGLESQLSNARDLTRQFKAAWKLAESRITELSKQLANMSDPSHYSSKDGRIRDLEATITKRNTFIMELETQLAAAKPVLTTSDRASVNIARNRINGAVCIDDLRLSMAELVYIIDRLCPPPKAPPTDAELAFATGVVLAYGGFGQNARKELEGVYQALRARGAK